MSAIRVLLLEDQPAEALYIRRILGQSKHVRFVLDHAERLSDFMTHLEESVYDILLIDLCVPDSEGLDTFLAVREAAPNHPIIVQSGLDETELAVEAVRRGAQDYIVKDEVGPRLLVRAIRYAIERRGIQDRLAKSEERYSLAMRGANAGLWDWDLVNNTIHVSQRWCDIMGLDSHGDRRIGPEQWLTAVSKEHREKFATALKAHLDGHTRFLEIEYRVQHPDGRETWCMCRGLAVRDGNGKPLRVAGSQSDVTRRKLAEEQLVHDALHDALTELPNRTLFADRLSHALARSERQLDRGFAVLFLDLDRFKTINDSLGHAAGDDLLRVVARRLAGTLRPADTIARMGGDEFAILLEDVSSPEAAARTAERMHSALNTPLMVGEHEVFVGMSIGIAHSSNDYSSPEEVLRDADAALYHAKHRGRNCVQVFQPELHSLASRRLELEMDLRRAIDRGEFSLKFQPIVSLADKEVQGFEALIRWESPKHGVVGPDEFIPLAEDTGLIVAIGDWVLREACHWAQRWAELNPRQDGVPAVSVNLSPRQLRRPNFVARIEEILEETGLDPRHLTLEITENALMHNPEKVAEMLQELRMLGVCIDIDDFGTGWSSLVYLRQFPVDRLKIDRSFVSGISERPGDLEIVRAILSLARNLNIEVVAEGIETLEQFNSLKLMDCKYGQGYLFARPKAATDDLYTRALAS